MLRKEALVKIWNGKNTLRREAIAAKSALEPLQKRGRSNNLSKMLPLLLSQLSLTKPIVLSLIATGHQSRTQAIKALSRHGTTRH